MSAYAEATDMKNKAAGPEAAEQNGSRAADFADGAETRGEAAASVNKLSSKAGGNEASAEACMLEFRDVSFTYPGDKEPTIDRLSFKLDKGEFVCLIGPSGCGKSTIFRLVNGLLKPDSGHIYVNGQDITGLKSYCGYMPQSDLLFPWRTVADNVRLPLEVRGGMSEAEMKLKVQTALVNVGLEDYGDKAPSELSGGMRQRAAFARTLMTGSELLLLDEPFSALDYLTRLNMREWLIEQWERDNKTVLFITHDVEEAVFLSGRVLAADTYPISSLRTVDIPEGYPRSRKSLEEPRMVEIREQLIGMLRKERA